MPPIELDLRFQFAVLFALGGYDDYGNQEITTPGTELHVRWEEVKGETTDPRGNVVRYDAIVVVDREISVGSILWQGRLEDIPGTTGVPDSDMYQVIRYSDIPDIKNRYNRRLVYLMRWGDTAPSTTT